MDDQEYALAKSAATLAGLPIGDGAKRLIGSTYYNVLLVSVHGVYTRCYCYKDVRRLIKYNNGLRTIKDLNTNDHKGTNRG